MMNSMLPFLSYVLAALAPLPLFVLGVAFYKRSQKRIGKVQDAVEFFYYAQVNVSEWRVGLTTMITAFAVWGGLIFYYCRQ
jgi:hypothetical protein